MVRKKLPFTRIAIVPESFFMHEFSIKLDQAIKRGADAIYLRPKNLLHNIPLDEWNRIVKCYSGITWIGGMEYFSLPFIKVIHYKASEENTTLDTLAIYRGKSCHSLEELKKAEAQGYDYTFLSPVFFTSTHPEIQPLGITTFAEWVSQVKIPVFALGGVNLKDIPLLLEAGAYGIAGISCFWEN
ncbi:MAG: thiamine phosphate synthase [Bacteroidia bacterium]|nr:thiamine phosphate synthase [Bacteroidia bacterium]MDW8158615.1 thiamine phosphate synthase [Bacteroidia bacterium]